MHSNPYRVALRRFSDASSVPRAILVDRQTFEPSIVGSLYEASLSRRCASPNTFYRYLQFAQALLSWDKETEKGLEHRLLSGIPLSTAEIETYALWLEDRFRDGGDAIPRKSIDTYNGYLRGAEEMVAWFMDQYFVADGADRGISLENHHRVTLRSWRRVRKKRVAEDIAPNLEDNDIEAIERFLRNAILRPQAEPRWTRAYLIWRLAIEFGLRIGEILALRLEDCPTRADPSFRIVRIEDRTGEPDPRGIYAPRPKTASNGTGSVQMRLQRYGTHYARLWLNPDLSADFSNPEDAVVPSHTALESNYEDNLSQTISFERPRPENRPSRDCEPDTLEENDSFETAALIALDTSYTINPCDDELDVFKVDLAAGQVVELVLEEDSSDWLRIAIAPDGTYLVRDVFSGTVIARADSSGPYRFVFKQVPFAVGGSEETSFSVRTLR